MSQNDVPGENRPFNRLPDKLLIKIFSHLQGCDRVSIQQKVRLDIICKRFRNCLSIQESWENNTELILDGETKPEGVEAQLQHVPKITHLNFTTSEKSQDLMTKVWQHTSKLKISKFTCENRDECRDCEKDHWVVLWVLSQFGPNLRELYVDFGTCDSTCQFVRVFSQRLIDCEQLESFTQRVVGNINEDNILDALMGKSLKYLSLENASFRGDKVAQLLNSIPEGCLRKFEICLSTKSLEAGVVDDANIDLVQLCNHVDPSIGGAASLQELIFDFVSTPSIPNALSLIPQRFPQVGKFEFYFSPNGENGLNVARGVGSFVHFTKNRSYPVKFKLKVASFEEHEGQLFEALQLFKVIENGPADDPPQQFVWIWTAQFGNVQVEVSC